MEKKDELLIVTEYFRKMEFIRLDEEIIYAIQNNLAPKTSIAVTKQRLIIHRGIKKKNQSGLSQDLYSFPLDKITNIRIKNHILSSELEISDGISYVSMTNLTRTNAKIAMNSISGIKAKYSHISSVIQNIPVKSEIQGPKKFCMYCGKQNRIPAKFCISCGKEMPTIPLEQDQTNNSHLKLCSNCNAKIMDSDIFCSECGQQC